MPGRDIYVLIRDEEMDNAAVEKQVRQLDSMLSQLEQDQEIFFKVYELVHRTGITHRRIKLLQVRGKKELKPFQFLINKN